MIEQTVHEFHRFLRGERDSQALLADNCTFYSPVMFKPSSGRLTVESYLNAARRGFAALPPEGVTPWTIELPNFERRDSVTSIL